jgi:hypothetical protein
LLPSEGVDSSLVGSSAAGVARASEGGRTSPHGGEEGFVQSEGARARTCEALLPSEGVDSSLVGGSALGVTCSSDGGRTCLDDRRSVAPVGRGTCDDTVKHFIRRKE